MVSFSLADAQDRKISGGRFGASDAVAVGEDGDDGKEEEGKLSACRSAGAPDEGDIDDANDDDGLERGGNADFIRVSRSAAAATAAAAASAASIDAVPSLPLVNRNL